jgi:hypothetical protein
MTDWLEPADVAAYLGLVLDQTTADRLAPITVAAQTWVERTRPDLDYTTAPGGDVYQGAVMYAALLFQQAASPSGLPSYDELGGGYDTGASMGQIYRLVGVRKPVIA